MADRRRTKHPSRSAGGRLDTRIAVLDAGFAAFSEAWECNVRSAHELCSEAARIRAHSRRLRGEVFRARLARNPNCAAISRRLLEEHFGTGILDVKAVVSELVNIAYSRGDGPIELSMRLRHDLVGIDVFNRGSAVPVRVDRDDDAVSFKVVDELSLLWGASTRGSHLWAQVRLQPGDRTEVGEHQYMEVEQGGADDAPGRSEVSVGARPASV